MAKVAKRGLQFAETDLSEREHSNSSLFELSVRKKEVLVAKSVVEEVRRRVMHFRGESKAEKEKEKHEREEELKVEEKSRAAAWAWYQHGNSGAPPISNSPNSPLSSRGLFGNVRKASRFKTEAALKVGNNSGKVEPRWDFETSLFDPYELDSVSKQIDHAFHDTTPKTTTTTHHPSIPPSKLTRSCSLRISFPRSLCRSISDVVSTEEMALGVRKCDCSKERTTRRTGGWSFRRISKAIHVLMHVPACDFNCHDGQQQLHHHHEHHHHHHQHEHEHHHHHHYNVKLKNGSHYGKSFSSNDRVKEGPFPIYPKAR